MLHRGDLLGELSRMKRTIAVGGTHGKTTTASMAALALLEAGREPAFLIGGELRAAGTNAAWGAGEWAVIEADESDRSFLKLGRDVAVVTNIELDHHATYASLAELEEAFEEFAAPAERARAGPGRGAAGRGRGGVTFGIEQGASCADAEDVRLHPRRFALPVEGVEVELQVPGEHNVLNALAALAALRAAGCRSRRPPRRSPTFTGAGRRFEEHGRTGLGARSSTTTTPTIRPRCGPRSAARGRSSRAGSWRASSRTSTRARDARARVRPRAGAGGPGRGARRLPRARAAEDFPGVSGYLVAEAAADAAGGRPSGGCPDSTTRSASCAAELGEGDLLLTLGAGDVDELARRLTT